jgi:hypothetical protein
MVTNSSITSGYDRPIRFCQAQTATIYRTIMHEESVKEIIDVVRVCFYPLIILGLILSLLISSISSLHFFIVLI